MSPSSNYTLITIQLPCRAGKIPRLALTNSTTVEHYYLCIHSEREREGEREGKREGKRERTERKGRGRREKGEKDGVHNKRFTIKHFCFSTI